jgi:hypothetical protein
MVANSDVKEVARLADYNVMNCIIVMALNVLSERVFQ